MGAVCGVGGLEEFSVMEERERWNEGVCGVVGGISSAEETECLRAWGWEEGMEGRSRAKGEDMAGDVGAGRTCLS